MQQGARNHQSHRVNPPGPGTHEVKSFPDHAPTSTYTKPISYSMPNGRQEPTPRRDRAGPGAYHANHDAIRQRIPICSFGGTKRLLSEPNRRRITPAPDLAHTETTSQSDNSRHSRAPQYRFGAEERSFEIPGMFSDKATGAKSFCSQRGHKMPAPGQYDPKKIQAVPGGKFSAREEQGGQSELSAPGPGSYSPDNCDSQISKRTPHHQFGTSGRLLLVEKKKPRAPGPGEYTTENITRTGHASVEHSAPKWSMNGRSSFNLAKDYV